MMIIKISPQVRDNNKIWYEVSENKITATINGVTDTFDFTNISDGELQLDEDGVSLIETILSEVPIRKAIKENGELLVELLFTIDDTETDQRLLFPKTMTLEEFNALMQELQDRNEVSENG